MYYISLNVRGLWDDPKFRSLKCFIQTIKVDMHLFQEMMNKGDSLWLFFKILKDWQVCATDVEGLSGGLVAIWSSQVCNSKPYKTIASILLEGIVKGFDQVNVSEYWTLFLVSI